MPLLQSRARRTIPAALGVLTVLSAGVVLVYDASPRTFRAEVHDVLASLPLVLIAVAYAVFQVARRASPMEWARTGLVALAFRFWAANQLCSDCWLAMIFNDIAIAAFILDVFLVIIARPAESLQEGNAERPAQPGQRGAAGLV